jgi:Big-like domain-containing protein
MSILSRAGLAAIALAAGVTHAGAQPATRRATNVAAILAFPGFFHNQTVVLRGEFAEVGQSHRFRAAEGEDSLQAIGKVGTPGTPQEIRAEFFDVGRLTKDDPRMKADVGTVIEREFGERWPKPGEALILNVLASESATPASAPTVRTIALEPARYKDQRVTITGQFRGRNLYGDLPNTPGVSKWDFIVKVADASVWVTNLRPRGKTLDLDVAARVDTGRWIEVSGVVRSGKGLTWIDGEAGTFAAAKPIADEPIAEPAVKAVGPSPEVIFSAPTEGEGDVPMATTIRLQFSRDLNPASIKGHVRGGYSAEEAKERGEPAPPAVEFAVQYVEGNRMLEVKFTKPLERFRTFKLELDPAITAYDGAPLKAFTLTFMTGGA